MMSMGVSPLRRVFLNNHAINRATTIPSKYMASIVSPASLKKPSTVTSGMQAAISTV